MKKIFTFAIALVCALAVSAQTTVTLTATADGTGDIVLNAGGTTVVYVYVTSTESFAGFQTDVYCPDGVTLTKVARGSMVDIVDDEPTHSTKFNKKEGFYTILSSNTDNTLYCKTTGDIVKATFTADASFMSGDIQLKNSVLAYPGGTKVVADDYTVTVVSTGIESVKANSFDTNAPIYNINGMQVKSATKGVYIQNGKKFVK